MSTTPATTSRGRFRDGEKVEGMPGRSHHHRVRGRFFGRRGWRGCRQSHQHCAGGLSGRREGWAGMPTIPPPPRRWLSGRREGRRGCRTIPPPPRGEVFGTARRSAGMPTIPPPPRGWFSTAGMSTTRHHRAGASGRREGRRACRPSRHHRAGATARSVGGADNPVGTAVGFQDGVIASARTPHSAMSSIPASRSDAATAAASAAAATTERQQKQDRHNQLPSRHRSGASARIGSPRRRRDAARGDVLDARVVQRRRRILPRLPAALPARTPHSAMSSIPASSDGGASATIGSPLPARTPHFGDVLDTRVVRRRRRIRHDWFVALPARTPHSATSSCSDCAASGRTRSPRWSSPACCRVSTQHSAL